MDTGPLVAFFHASGKHHHWAVEQFAAISGPIITCEAVITEASYLLSRARKPAWSLVEKVIEGTVRIDWQLQDDAVRVRALMHQYRDRPMSFADACLVRMAETTGLPICTLDSDFRVYRRRGRDPLTVICP